MDVYCRQYVPVFSGNMSSIVAVSYRWELDKINRAWTHIWHPDRHWIYLWLWINFISVDSFLSEVWHAKSYVWMDSGWGWRVEWFTPSFIVNRSTALSREAGGLWDLYQRPRGPSRHRRQQESAQAEVLPRHTMIIKEKKTNTFTVSLQLRCMQRTISLVFYNQSLKRAELTCLQRKNH